MITFQKANMTITITHPEYCTIQQGDKKLSVGYTIATGRGIRLANPVQYIDGFRVLVSVFEELYDNSDEIEENRKLQEEKKAINGFALDDDIIQQIQSIQKKEKAEEKTTEVITLDDALEFFSQKGTVTVTRELDDYTSRAYISGKEIAKKNGGAILIDMQDLEDGQNYVYKHADGTIQTIHMS